MLLTRLAPMCTVGVLVGISGRLWTGRVFRTTRFQSLRVLRLVQHPCLNLADQPATYMEALRMKFEVPVEKSAMRLLFQNLMQSLLQKAQGRPGAYQTAS